MYKISMTYNDFNDEEVKEDLYFNLSKAELLEMNFRAKGGLVNYIESILNARDTQEIAEFFKLILVKAYGEKTPDGKHFMKTPEIERDFVCSVPYSELYVKLSTNADAAAEFINAVIPKELLTEYKKAEAEGKIPPELSDRMKDLKS